MRTIVHVIDNLGRGGAETLLTDLLPVLSQRYNIVLVTLDDLNEFDESVYEYCSQHYCLHHTSNLSLLRSVNRLKEIIKRHQPILVRSQLYWSTIIARLACPKRVPFIFSVHITMETYKETLLGNLRVLLELATISKKQTMIGVTQQVLDGYVQKFKFKGNAFLLHNYVKKEFFTVQRNQKTGAGLKLMAVGNLRLQKNYHYLIEAFKKLKGKDVSLDIYGEGLLRESLANEIRNSAVAVTLKGKASNISELIKEYDAFVMVSSFEGFGIAVAEAMAAGIPLILSDIPVLREVTDGNAFFIDLAQPETFVKLIEDLLHNERDIASHVEINKKISREKYTQEVYLRNLDRIYSGAIDRSLS